MKLYYLKRDIAFTILLLQLFRVTSNSDISVQLVRLHIFPIYIIHRANLLLASPTKLHFQNV